MDPQSPSTADTKVVWGLVSSLYCELDPSLVLSLERAVYLQCIRAFDESIVIFESLPAILSYNEVVVLEHFSVLWSQGRIKDAFLLLNHVLEYAEQHDDRFWELGPYTLLRVLRAKSDLFHRGSWVNGRESLKEIKGWLDGIAPQAYTDVQVSAQTHQQTQSSSNFENNLVNLFGKTLTNRVGPLCGRILFSG